MRPCLLLDSYTFFVIVRSLLHSILLLRKDLCHPAARCNQISLAAVEGFFERVPFTFYMDVFIVERGEGSRHTSLRKELVKSRARAADYSSKHWGKVLS